MQDRIPPPWAPSDPPSASHLNALRDIALSVGTITGGGATEVMQLPHGTSVFTPIAQPPVNNPFKIIRFAGPTRTFAGDSAALTLPGGMYWGYVQKRTATLFPPTHNGSTPTFAAYWSDVDSTSPVIVINMLEIGLAVTEHNMATDIRIPCLGMKEQTAPAANGASYPVSNGMTFDLYVFHGVSLACGLS